MTKYSKYIITLCCICLTLGLAGWYYTYYIVPLISGERVVNVLTEQPDAIITKLQATVFDAQGQPTQILHTPMLQHYAQEDRNLLSYPRILVFRETGQPWQIQSIHGLAPQSGDEITLWGNVILYQPPGPDNNESTIRTDKLIHNTQQNTASTDSIVTLEQPGLTIQSTGMRAYLDNEIIQLLANTTGRYEPPQDN